MKLWLVLRVASEVYMATGPVEEGRSYCELMARHWNEAVQESAPREGVDYGWAVVPPDQIVWHCEEHETRPENPGH
jgi:hypothetical protein